MPIYRRVARELPEDAADLTQLLVAEWQHPSDAGEPVIIEEAPSRGVLHLYVVWGAWAEWKPVDRSEVIMNAFTEVHGLDRVLDVTLAMGLTASEAERMGLHWE